MSNSIHGVGQEGAGGASSYSPQDGASGSAPVELPQEDPIDIFEIIAGWWEEYRTPSPRAPLFGVGPLAGCSSPLFASSPSQPTPQSNPPPSQPSSQPPASSASNEKIQAAPQEEVESEFVTIEGIQVPRGSKDITRSYHKNDGLVAISISKNFTYLGIPISKGTALFYKINQQPEKITLSKNFDFVFNVNGKEHSLPAARGKRLSIHKNGIPGFAVLYKEWEFNGDRFPGESELWFENTGKITKGWLKTATTVQGYPIIGSFHCYEDGGLLEFRLAQDHRVHGIPFKECTLLHLSPQQTIERSKIGKPHIIFGTRYDEWTVIEFNQWNRPNNAYRIWSPAEMREQWEALDTIFKSIPEPKRQYPPHPCDD